MAGGLMWIVLSYLAGALATYGVLGSALARSLRQAGNAQTAERWAEEAAARRAATGPARDEP